MSSSNLSRRRTDWHAAGWDGSTDSFNNLRIWAAFMKLPTFCLLASAIFAIAGSSSRCSADLIVNVYQDGAESVIEWGNGGGGGGSLDLTNLSNFNTGSNTVFTAFSVNPDPVTGSTAVWGRAEEYSIHRATNALGDDQAFSSASFFFLTGWIIDAGSDSFGIDNRNGSSQQDLIFMDRGGPVFTDIQGSMRRTGDFSDLNFTPMTMSIAGSTDKIVFLGMAPVPEPSAAILLGFGLVGLSFRRRRSAER